MKKPVATIKEIATRLNISVSTVSRALHDHPSIGLRTKMRVKELAQEAFLLSHDRSHGTSQIPMMDLA